MRLTPCLLALLGTLVTLPVAAEPVGGGQLRALAVTTAQRLPVWPDIPAPAGQVPGFEAVSWLGLFGPAGLPAPVAARLRAEHAKWGQVIRDNAIRLE